MLGSIYWGSNLEPVSGGGALDTDFWYLLPDRMTY